jgi:hypothetical protein
MALHEPPRGEVHKAWLELHVIFVSEISCSLDLFLQASFQRGLNEQTCHVVVVL